MECFSPRCMETACWAEPEYYLEGLQLNTIQIAAPAAAPLSAFDSKLMLCDMPFLFDDHEHAERVLDGRIGQQIAADLPKNCRMRVLAYWVSGFRSVFSKKSPIESIEDIKEIKIRVMESPVFIDIFPALSLWLPRLVNS